MPIESYDSSKNICHSFLQSREWEQFNQAIGCNTWRVDGVLAIKVEARRGVFLHIPHISSFSSELCAKLIKLAEKEHCGFIRVSPLMSDLPENRDIFSSLCFRKAPLYIHPESAWILEIDRDEEDLLSEMRKTTRYSIRKAQNDGVKTHISGKSEDIERFWKLYEITAKRQDFVSYSKKFIETEFKSFGDNIFWVLNEYAAAVIVLNENEGFYHHGASTHHPTASYAVQWEAIKELRRRGRKWYNFWGVWNDPKSPQAGLSNFKRGFGGFEESYVKTQDLPLSAKYWINYIVESARKKQRGF